MIFSLCWKAEDAGLRRQQRTAAAIVGQGQPQARKAANTVGTLTRRGSCKLATVRAPLRLPHIWAATKVLPMGRMGLPLQLT